MLGWTGAPTAARGKVSNPKKPYCCLLHVRTYTCMHGRRVVCRGTIIVVLAQQSVADTCIGIFVAMLDGARYRDDKERQNFGHADMHARAHHHRRVCATTKPATTQQASYDSQSVPLLPDSTSSKLCCAMPCPVV